MEQIQVPTKDKDGNTKTEPLNQNGPQSDGSYWNQPKPLISPDHKHFFIQKDPGKREAVCECGFGGFIFPHTTILKDGHIYNLDNELII